MPPGSPYLPSDDWIDGVAAGACVPDVSGVCTLLSGEGAPASPCAIARDVHVLAANVDAISREARSFIGHVRDTADSRRHSDTSSFRGVST